MGKRIYTCDFDYFETIDTEEKAYWLGFIFADGYVWDDVRVRHLVKGDTIQRRKGLTITLQESDTLHLEKFNDSLNSSYPIHHYSGEGKNPYCRTHIESDKLFQDLVNLGCIPRKSLVVKYPISLNPKLDKHFIRGYFDGNGCISFGTDNRNKKWIECNLTSTREMLESIQNILPIEGKWSKRNNNCINNYTLRFYGGIKNTMLLNYLYSDCTVYLERKYSKYKEWLVFSGRA